MADLASKITIREGEPRVRALPVFPTAVANFIGLAERGPIGVPTDITSFEEYVNVFGGLIASAEMPLAVRQFFTNGGRRCFVTRTVHYSNIVTGTIATAAKGSATFNTAAGVTKGEVVGTIAAPFNLEPGDTLIGSVGGAADQTATFNATAAFRESGNNAPFALVDGDTLTLQIDGGGTQTVTFNASEFVSIGAATAAEVAAVINAETTGLQATAVAGPKVRIQSDRRGTGSIVNITGGTANAAGKLNYTTGAIAGTGNVSNIDSVALAEVKTIVEAAWTNNSGVTVSDTGGGLVKIETNASGAAASVQVKATSTADDELGLDNATHAGSAGNVATLRLDGKTQGVYANSLTGEIATATSGVAAEFNIVIRRSGIVVETWANLTMDSTAANYVQAIINHATNGSSLIAAVDLVAAGTVSQRRPANVGSPYTAFTGGNDGLTSIDDNDFIGDSASQTGIRALDANDVVTLLAIPDRATTAVQNAMITYCETTRNKLMFAVLDPPAGLTHTAMVTHRDSLSPGTPEVAAIYWPRVKIPNPSKTIFGSADNLTVAPSGSVCGLYARVDGEKKAGPFAQPGGSEVGLLQNVLDVESASVKREEVRDILYPERINPITIREGVGVFLDGVRTLKGDGNFPSIGERRGVSDFEKVAKAGTDFVRLQNNTPELRAVFEKTLRLLCIDRMSKGAFASYDPATAFFVDVSDQLNKPSVRFQGQLKARVGLATNKPAEFIEIEVSQDLRALEAELAGS